MDTLIQNIVNNFNTKPIQELEGLSPIQMHSLLYDLFSENCPLRLKDKISDETLDKINFFRLCEEFLKIVQRETILKLTPKGSLQKKVVKELYDHRFILEPGFESCISKNFIEDEILAIHNAKIICLLSGLIKKTNNTFTLTAKGMKLLAPAKRNELFKLVLETFIKKFNWEYNDGYSEGMNGQFGIGYVLILLMIHGNGKNDIQYYADKYLSAFPDLIHNFTENKWTTPMEDFYSSFAVRVFERFLYWFNFVNVDGIRGNSRSDVIEISDVFNEVFILKI